MNRIKNWIWLASLFHVSFHYFFNVNVLYIWQSSSPSIAVFSVRVCVCVSECVSVCKRASVYVWVCGRVTALLVSWKKKQNLET